ncbi:MAG: heparinase II/III family protein [Alphaproteobacteria bacterium]|nr:heparinase II/III family protein [Alphaproteobacteria bacterium]
MTAKHNSETPGVGGALRYQFARFGAGLPGYGASLGDDDPGPLALALTPLWRGDIERGAAIRDGVFPFAGQVIRQSSNPWSAAGAGDAWLAALNGFSWLADLAAEGGDASRRRGIGLIMDWIDYNRDWAPLSWNAPVLGARVSAWLSHFTVFLGGADEMAQRRVRKNLLRQSRHLDRVAGLEGAGAARVAALKGLIHACLCLTPMRKRLPQAWGRLSAELGRQILPDGGHIERSPSVHLSVLRDLVEIKQAFLAASLTPPAGLIAALKSMAPMLRFYRHGDGGLALFNDTAEGSASDIDAVLGLCEAAGKAPASAPNTGFERVSAGRSLILMDLGTAPPPGLDRHAHAGALSFEFSIGKERLIVNCGAAVSDDENWRDAQRSTAAHSTLSLSLTNSSALTRDGVGQRRSVVAYDRTEADGAVLIDAVQDGFVGPLNFRHARRLYLSADGGDLRAEDRLERADPALPVAPRRFEIRFHLFPGVQASLLANHGAALLRTPSGAGWRFRSDGAAIRLEDSVYMGQRGEARRSQQLVLSGETRAEDKSVKWALQRESR